MSNKNKIILFTLIGSITINLVFIGGIGYRALALQEPPLRPLPPSIGWTIRDLSEERQTELRPKLQASNDDIRPLRGEVFQAMHRVNALMRADDFDTKEIEEAFRQLRSSSSRYQELSHKQSINLLSELTREERLTAQEFVQRRGPRGEREARRGRGRSGFPPVGGPPPQNF